MCGEQAATFPGAEVYLGSPPRVRGTGMAALMMASIMGITPACAGNRIHVYRYVRPWRDHPRVCGEQ